jgi:hypothetical protein
MGRLAGRHVRYLLGAALVTAAIGGAALVTASPAGASTIPTTALTTGLSMVHVSSPHAPRNVFLKTKGTLAEFTDKLRADHIAKHLPATGPGSCTGSTTYSVELTYKTGPKVLLLAHECKGAVTGNLSGNVKAFVKYLSSLVG